METFWDFFRLIVVSFVFIAYLIMLFSIITDLIRDRETSGWVKAIWALFLIFLPFLTALAYLIFRGDGMNRRSHEVATRLQEAQNAYIQGVAGTSPAQQIADAKSLLDSGTITEDEFRQLKSRALS
ncbi:SHOCT domain-containing protein [Hoyosella altamirensis]|uniref:SHOCT domain-containing protein n=1 Tax=Hoyosella altamirensis TaxID=616997 RepID=UPI0007DB262C|nr:SHOCT domain-containing protein [Hoyosella altamirensis]